VGEGSFKVILTPTDRAGNSGEPGEARVRVLSSLQKPAAKPSLFYSADGDDLAQAATLQAKVARDASVSLTIRDAGGTVVRNALEDVAVTPGVLRFEWDGTDDAGAFVPDARYIARFRITRPQGSYAHEVSVRVMPFRAWTKRWWLRRGDRVTLKVASAEPLSGKPRVEVKQPGVERYSIRKWKITRLSSTTFKVVIKSKSEGKRGKLRVFVSGTDSGGGTQARQFTLSLR
jgi:hypothetical protein